MRKCPTCNTATSRLRVVGWLVYGEGVMQESSLGEEQLTAIVPNISLNKAGFMHHCYAVCDVCGYKAPLIAFVPVRTCVLSGLEATTQITFFDRDIWVHESMLPVIAQMPTSFTTDWEELCAGL